VRFGRRFARLATDAVVRWPRLWPLFRPVLRRYFDRLAPVWDQFRTPESLAPFREALGRIEDARIERALDVGTGTGEGAFAIAGAFPEAEVVGVDVAPAMLEEGRARVTTELRNRVTFREGDASALPFGESHFDLVTHANMIPFLDETARVTRPGGWVVYAFSSGAETPIYVAPARLRRELERRGFTDFAEISAGRGVAVLARKGERV
jgi:ubiquinone/menaquinone biosynthesis C-methylase UbiE